MEITIHNRHIALKIKEVTIVKNYDFNNDYILDILEKEEEKIVEELFEGIDEKNNFKLDKLLAIKESIRKIELEKVFIEGKASCFKIK